MADLGWSCDSSDQRPSSGAWPNKRGMEAIDTAGCDRLWEMMLETAAKAQEEMVVCDTGRGM